MLLPLYDYFPFSIQCNDSFRVTMHAIQKCAFEVKYMEGLQISEHPLLRDHVRSPQYMLQG